MRSTVPKVLHAVAGRPMLRHVLAALEEMAAAPDPVVIVVGPGADEVRAAVGNSPTFAVQTMQLGTGHAALAARDQCAGMAPAVLVLCGDVPLITGAVLDDLVKAHRGNPGAVATVLTASVANPAGYGRVVRDSDGTVRRIVEEAEADSRLADNLEVNAGIGIYNDEWLWGALAELAPASSGEIYLTDLVERAVAEGLVVAAHVTTDPGAVLGVNDRLGLALAEARMRDRIRRRHMAAGVTIIAPDCTWIDAEASIGAETVLWPNTYVLGASRVGKACVVGPGTVLRGARLSDGAMIELSVADGADIGPGCHVGPFAHLRSGTRLDAGARVGSFAEIKGSHLAEGAKMGHFGYVGDATVGKGANIGAGTVTCNFDGRRKHPTIIGAGAFVGSGTMLVAPVTLGDGSSTGAGSVVVRDVPPGVVVRGVPAKPPPSPESRSGSDGSGSDDAGSDGAGSNDGPGGDEEAGESR